MSYFSTKARINQFIEKRVIPALYKTDLDYNKVLSLIIQKTCCSKKMAIEYLDNWVSLGAMKREGDIITIPDDKLEGWLKAQKDAYEAKKKEEEKIGVVLVELEKTKQNNIDKIWEDNSKNEGSFNVKN